MTEHCRFMDVMSYDERITDPASMDSMKYMYNLIMNELLQEHNFIDKQLYLTQCPCSFDIENYYFAISGLRKSIYTNVFGISAQEYRNLCRELIPSIERVFEEGRYHFEIFMITVDGSKQLGFFFSPRDDWAIAPEQLAERLLRIQQEFCMKRIFQGTQDYAVQFAMVGLLHGVKDLREGYLRARRLSDASFFRMVPAIFTEEVISSWTRGTSYHAALEQSRIFAKAMKEGNIPRMDTCLDMLFLQTLKNSFDFALLRDVLSYLKHVFFTEASACNLLDLPIDSIFHLSSYLTIESLHAAIRDAARVICEAVQKQGIYQDAVAEAISFIRRHYRDPQLSLTMIADYATVSPSYLSRQFNRQVGCPIYDYIQNIRLDSAAQMLINSEEKVKDIALNVGIPDSRYFSVLFKKKYEHTPQQYRKANNQK